MCSVKIWDLLGVVEPSYNPSKQEDHEFGDSLVYMARSSLRKQKQNETESFLANYTAGNGRVDEVFLVEKITFKI